MENLSWRVIAQPLLVPLIIPLMVSSSILAGSRALAQEENAAELYNLCSQFPFNSRCEGYEAPVALDDRAGEKALCALQVPDKDKVKEKSFQCKFEVVNDRLSLYIEQGDRLAILDDRQPTQEMVIMPDQIQSLSYLEYRRRQHAGGGLIGVLVYTLSSAKRSELEITFQDPNAWADNGLTQVKLLAAQDQGLPLRNQLAALAPVDVNAIAPTPNLQPNPADLAKLRQTGSCNKCNLQGADLQNLDLVKADLDEANLEGANLAGTNLERASLEGTNLRYANLEGVNLSKADLTTEKDRRTDLRHANLRGANLTQVRLKGANLSHANLENANLSAASLQGAYVNFWNGEEHELFSNLTGANLSQANLQQAKLPEAVLQEANLDGADLRGADLSQANLSGATLTASDCSGTNFDEAQLISTNFANANLSQTILKGANLRGANLENTALSTAQINADTLFCDATLPPGFSHPPDDRCSEPQGN